jgi:hypothetical protein
MTAKEVLEQCLYLLRSRFVDAITGRDALRTLIDKILDQPRLTFIDQVHHAEELREKRKSELMAKNTQ